MCVNARKHCLVFGVFTAREAAWNKREDEVSCRSHQAEMSSTFLSGNIRHKLGKGETQEAGRGGKNSSDRIMSTN